MFTLLAITNFFDDLTALFESYTFIDKYLYSPEMDFSKLKPYILNNSSATERKDSWLGIIFTHSHKRRGDIYYQSFNVQGETYIDEDTGKELIPLYLCQQVSTELSFNIVSNSLYTLEALENEFMYFYSELKGFPCPIPKLPEFTGFAHNITFGELTKYSSGTYGELCSLGISCILNYPILLKGETRTLIKTIKLLIGNKILGSDNPNNSIFYENTLETNT